MKMKPMLYNNAVSPFADWKQHIRLHPEMYIGAIGDGSMPEDGIYRLVQEVLDNALIGIRESHSNPLIEVSFNDRQVSIQHSGFFLLPIDWLAEHVSDRRPDGIGSHKLLVDPIKYYGVGLKVVNLLSSHFLAQAIVDGKTIIAEFERGSIINETDGNTINETRKEAIGQHFGSLVTIIISFIPDSEIFGNFHFVKDYLKQIFLNYMSKNENLEINFIGI